MSWVEDVVSEDARRWEDLYRTRNQSDRVVRSTHGVNCTGGCSWNVHVKNGVVALETQATDYPRISCDVPAYEPRGCQRGISFSWYLYSPLRVKYPYLRGVLADLWRDARSRHADPVDAWASIMRDPAQRRRIQEARGKGGLRRASWDEALEVVAAATVHTLKTHGADRIVGFSPIPAMSMLSFAGGSRFLQLLGGVNLSFYDWYCDLPNASPEVWGEQTDVAESADWYHSKYIVSMGSNVAMTRTPDVHFVAEARHDGAKLVVFSPDFSDTCKYADRWIPIHAGQDGAFWLAAVHVMLREFHHERPVAPFLDYVRRYSDAPFLVEIEERDGVVAPGRLLPASRLARSAGEENGDFKFLVWDRTSAAPRMPQGTLGFRWQSRKGQWNLEPKDGKDGAALDPELTFLERHDAVVPIAVTDHADGKVARRGVPVRWVETDRGRVAVATIYDLLFAQYGVSRGLPGEWPAGYDDEGAFTPAWQERYTGVGRDEVIRFAREWATTAERTGGKCSILIGAGVNQWYHADLAYRAAIAGLVLCGCVGKNGGGLNHYVGQEKLAPVAPWAQIAFGLDWARPPRQQNAPSFHYVHSDQWRYEDAATEARLDPARGADGVTAGHTVDHQVRAVRLGWLPFYPQFDRSPSALVREARAAGASTPAEIFAWAVQQLKERKLRFAVEDPDAPESWPRLWFVWRANALSASAKGQEYFLKHYLGTHHGTVAPETARGGVKEVAWRDAPQGKLDLVVDLNFRMDTSALYSDVILPAATWYEKDDLNTTDMHSYIHPLQAAVPPCWESRSDWDIFKSLAKRVGELCRTHLPGKVEDLVATPLQHDTPAELAQREIRDWTRGECEPLPGKTMPSLSLVERDYAHLYERFVSFGPVATKQGIGAHGLSWPIDDMVEELLRGRNVEAWGGATYPSLAEVRDAADVILHLAPETNGEAAHRAFSAEEKKVGLPLADLAAWSRGARLTFADLARQPRRLLDSPCWTGLTGNGRTYSAYVLNVERLVPWRTLTGRQHLYLDHPGFLAWGEALPTYKPKPDASVTQDLLATAPDRDRPAVRLGYLTPHGKWGIHSTYGDNLRMLTLSRGTHPVWLNPADAARIGVADNEWVELLNDHGVVVSRAVVSARVPAGLAFLYHAPERTIGVPRAPGRGGKRAGGHNSLTRVRLKPSLMLGGYGQFTWSMNYWGPTGNNRDTFVLARKLEGAPRY